MPKKGTRRFAGYAFVRTVVEGLLAGRGMALGTILGTEAFGVWALFRIAAQYAAVAGLGAQRGVEVEVSSCGREQEDEAGKIGRVACTFTLIVFTALGLLSLGAAILLPDGDVRSVAIGLALGLLAERLWLYGQSYMRARGGLRVFARLELIQAATSTILVVTCALAAGLYGAFVGLLLAYIAGLALLRGHAPFRPLLGWSRLQPLLRIGWPLSISHFLSTILTTVDRLVVASMLGVGALGIYAFAVALSSAGAALGMTVRTVVFPDLFRQARADGGASTIAKHVDRTVVPFAWLLAPVLGLIALAIEPALALALPAFVDAADPAQVFVFIGVAQGLVTLGMLGMVAADRQTSLPLVTLAAVLLNLGLSVSALHFGLGLMGLAAAALLCRLGYALAILVIASGEQSLRSFARLALKAGLPVACCALLVWALAHTLVLAEPEQFGIAVLLYLAVTGPAMVLVLIRLSRASRPG